MLVKLVKEHFNMEEISDVCIMGEDDKECSGQHECLPRVVDHNSLMRGGSDQYESLPHVHSKDNSLMRGGSEQHTS